MPILKTIQLSALTIIDTISAAPIGTLLQIAPMPGVQPFTALTASLSGALGSIPGVVLLEGNDAGTFLDVASLNNCAAIDLSALAEIAVLNAGPHKPKLGPISTGTVFHVQTQTGSVVFAMSVRMANQSGLVGYLHLGGQSAGTIGNVQSALYVGIASVIEKL